MVFLLVVVAQAILCIRVLFVGVELNLEFATLDTDVTLATFL